MNIVLIEAHAEKEPCLLKLLISLNCTCHLVYSCSLRL